jgi:HSP20 family protein
MSNFFEKLKKGMGIEGPVEAGAEEIKEKPPRKTKVKKPPKESKLPTGQAKKLEIKAEPIEPKVEKIEEPEVKKEEEIKEEKVKIKKEKWFETEGELAADIYQTENDLVIQSAIAGVRSENLDISIEGDVITIKGNREKPGEGGIYFTQECYWGPFSRKVILPVEIDPNRIEATMKEGILTIRLPKIERERKRKIEVKS